MICGRTPEELLRDITSFHGYVAPGLLIGAFMVDSAYRLMGKKIEADAIVETRHCLPDAIQIFSPCTVGNGWLKILDLGKFAITFHERHTHEGVRLWLDLDKAQSHPDVYNWFLKRVSKKDLPVDVLVNAIFKAGADILSHTSVKVIRHASREKKNGTRICMTCREVYAEDQGETCLACQGDSYYEKIATA